MLDIYPILLQKNVHKTLDRIANVPDNESRSRESGEPRRNGKMENKINALSEQLQELAPYTARGKNFSEEKTEEYYCVLRAFQKAKKEQRENPSVAKYQYDNKKTFVNSYGEATKREITTATYDRQQKRLDREIMRLVGK